MIIIAAIEHVASCYIKIYIIRNFGHEAPNSRIGAKIAAQRNEDGSWIWDGKYQGGHQQRDDPLNGAILRMRTAPPARWNSGLHRFEDRRDTLAPTDTH